MSARAKSNRRRALEIGAAALLLVGIFVVSEGLLRRRVGPGAAPDAAPWSGPTAVVTPRSIAEPIAAAGTVQPIRVARMASRVQGQVERVAVRPGDRVRAGDIVVALSAPELAARRAGAAAASASARAVLEQAARDRERMETLRREDVVPDRQVELARQAQSVAAAEVARSAEAERDAAELASQATLAAPFDGIVLDRLVDPGDLATPGRVLVTLGDESAFRLEAAVAELPGAGLATGATLRCEVASIGLATPCPVSEIVPAADPATRTLLVKADLPLTPGLTAGTSGSLVLAGAERRALTVPAAAIRRVGGVLLASVVTDHGLATRHVRVGAELAGGEIEILSGLAEGERVALP